MTGMSFMNRKNRAERVSLSRVLPNLTVNINGSTVETMIELNRRM